MKSLSLTPLIVSLGIIIIFGLTTILSIHPDLLPNQITFFLAGLLIVILISRLDSKFIRSLAPILYVASICSLLVTFVLGNATRGSVRWIDIGPFRLQSSELIKPLLIIFFANSFSKKIENPFQWLGLQIIFLLIPVLLIFMQPDLGSSLVIISFWFG